MRFSKKTSEGLKKEVITNEVPSRKNADFACISEINHWSLSFSFASFFHRRASGN